MSEREMFGELNALVGTIAAALSIEPEAAAKAIETGEIVIDLQTDDRGLRFVAVTHGSRTAHVYPGAIRHEGGQ